MLLKEVPTIAFVLKKNVFYSVKSWMLLNNWDIWKEEPYKINK